MNWGLSANLKEEIVGRGTSGQLAKTVMDFKQRNVDTVREPFIYVLAEFVR